MADGKIVIETGLDNSGVEKDLSKLQSLIKGSAVAVGAALAATTALVLNLGTAYETSMAKASTLFGDTNVDTKNLDRSMLSLSNSSGKAATELNEALYQAMSAGVPVTEDMGDAVGFVDQAVKLATGGFTTSASAVDVMSTAINAYGMKASDAAKVSDILVMIQNKGKTTVDLLAASLGRVLPSAAAFNVSLADVGSSMAIMTASGINTAEATTYLKGMLSELADTGSGVSKILKEKTGKSFSDLMAEGKSLGDIMSILMGSVDGNATAFANLWSSQEAGTGALSIANQGAEKYNQTLQQMQNSAGTTDDAYSKMSDTLEFKTNQMVESAKNLAISVYGDIQEPLKDAADIGVQALSSLAGALSSSTFQSMAKSAGKGIAEFAKGIGNIAESALPVIGNLLIHVASNLKTYATAMGVAVVATKALSITKTITSLLQGYQAMVVQLALAEKIGAIATAADCAALTAKEFVVGVLSKRIPLATAAQTLWNAAISANPIGMIVLAIGAFAGAVGLLKTELESQAQAETKNIEKMKESAQASSESLKAAQERKQSYAELVEAQNSQAAGDILQANNLRDLNNELASITDANGNVKAGEEDRAAFITSQLSSALGIEISMTGNQISNYQELQAEIAKAIEQKRLDAVMTAQQAKYEEAVAKQMEVATRASAEYTAMKQKEAEVEKQKATLATLNEQYTQAVVDGNKAQVAVLGTKISKQEEAVKKSEEALQKESEAYATDTALLAQYASDIDMYTALAEAAATGNSAQIEQAITNITNGIKTASNATNEELQKQVVAVSATESLIKAEVAKGTPGYTQAMADQASQATIAACEELAKAPPKSAAELSKVPKEAVAALVAADMKRQLSSEASGAVQGMLDQFSGMDAETQAAFAQVIYGALQGLEGFDQLADPATEGVEAFLESLRTGLEVHSPSRAVADIFAQVGPGATQGVEEGSGDVETSGTSLVDKFLSGLNTGVTGGGFGTVGSLLVSAFTGGIDGSSYLANTSGVGLATSAQTGAGSVNPRGVGATLASLFSGGITGSGFLASAAGLLLGNTAKSGAGSVNPNGTGSSFGTLFSRGIGSVIGTTGLAGKSIADSAMLGAKNVDPNSVGNTFGNTYGAGIGQTTSIASSAAKSIATAANGAKGLASVGGRDAGYNFGAGFAGGISSAIGSAVSSAASLARSALNAIKATLDIHSPSKKSYKLGAFTGKGFTNALYDSAREAIKASTYLGKAALEGLDVSSAAEKLKTDVLATNARIGATMTSNVITKVQEESDDKKKQEQNMKLLAQYVVEGIKNSGLAIMIDDTELGRLEEGVFAI